MASLRELSPEVRPAAQALVRWLQRRGIRVTVTSARRSYATQAALYAKCQRQACPYPVAPPGHSQHALGLAWDMVLEPPAYALAGRAWEHIGRTWGGRFGDKVHFDWRPV